MAKKGKIKLTEKNEEQAEKMTKKPKKTEDQKRATALKKISNIQAWAKDGMPSQGLHLQHLQTLAAFKSQFGGGSVGTASIYRALRVFGGKVYPVRLYSDPSYVSIATLNTIDLVDQTLADHGDVLFSQLESLHGELFGSPFTEFMESTFLEWLLSHRYVITPVEGDYMISGRSVVTSVVTKVPPVLPKKSVSAASVQSSIDTAISTLTQVLSSSHSPPTPSFPLSTHSLHAPSLSENGSLSNQNKSEEKL